MTDPRDPDVFAISKHGLLTAGPVNMNVGDVFKVAVIGTAEEDGDYVGFHRVAPVLDAARQSDRAEAGLRKALTKGLADALTKDWPGDTRQTTAPAIADYLLKRPEVRAALQAAPVSIDRERLAKAVAAVSPQGTKYPDRLAAEYDRLSHPDPVSGPEPENEAKCECGRDIFRPWIDGIQEPWKHWVEPMDHPARPVSGPSSKEAHRGGRADDPSDPANGAQYLTGKPCIEADCNDPAGTAWSPHWCQRHNAERLARISASFDQMSSDMAARPVSGPSWDTETRRLVEQDGLPG